VLSVENTPTVSSRPCPLCAAKNRKCLFTQRFRGASEGTLLSQYDVVVCGECGFGFADKLPEQSAFNAYYQQMSKYERHSLGGQESEYDARRFPSVAAVIRDHLEDVNARILDIGCANGGLLNALKAIGYANLLGIDPSPACGQIAQRVYGIEVLASTISNLPPGIGKFDLIIFSSVLEHLRELHTDMLTIRSLLNPHGRLYVEVPDATRFFIAQEAPFQEFSIEHINYFSPASLNNLARKHGLGEVFTRRNAVEPTIGSVAHEIRGMFELVGESNQLPLIRDAETEAGLSCYIESSSRIEQRIHKLIEPWVVSGKPIIVWGVGTHTQRLLATSRLAAAKIRAFVDSNPHYQGKYINGVAIVPPAELHNMPEPILVSSHGFQREIAAQIRNELRLNNEIILLYEL
jgi:SAM-dependent methyltransferase